MEIKNLLKFKNKPAAILGFGLEGKSNLNLLEKLGFTDITILDKKKIDFTNHKSVNGEKYLNDLDKYELIFKTPGISPYIKELKPYKNKLISGTEIFFNNYKGKVIGITATKGKSTISTLCHKTLEKAQIKSKIVGNIGKPILDEIDILNHDIYDYIVYELSSYMLEGLKPKCFIGFLGNIYPCHLDWHNNNFETYKQAKLNLLENSENIIINNEFTELLKENQKAISYGLQGEFSDDVQIFGTEKDSYFDNSKILLKGEHNIKNIIGVIAINSVIELDNKEIEKGSLNRALREVLTSFSGLPHRLENIGTYNGITFIDDGISTTPESTIEAIKSYLGEIGTIILGGKDAGFTKESYNNLVDQIKESRIDNIILLPNTGKEIFGEYVSDLKIGESKNFDLGDSYSPNIFYTNNMKDIINFVYNNNSKGKICLLSNAAQSYNLWSGGYIEKGEDYKKEVINQFKVQQNSIS